MAGTQSWTILIFGITSFPVMHIQQHDPSDNGTVCKIAPRLRTQLCEANPEQLDQNMFFKTDIFGIKTL